MSNSKQVENVYVIDNKMFGFSKYCSSFLITGDEIALIDTGTPKSADIVRNAIINCGFDLKDISYVFITHIHFDHSGCAGILAKEMPNAKVLVHPKILKHMIDPTIVNENTRKATGEKMAARFGEMVGISPSSIQSVADGEVIDIGSGKRLRIIYTPGHNSSHIVILDEKEGGLFAGDAPGLYWSDEDILVMPSPVGCDLDQAKESLKMIIGLSPSKLFLGHYGICNTPDNMMQRALGVLQKRIDVGLQAMKQGKQDELASRIIASIDSEIEKLRKMGGDDLYQYIIEELIPMWTRGFTGYYEKLQKK